MLFQFTSFYHNLLNVISLSFFYFYIKVTENESVSYSVVSNSLEPHGL